jgi:hypothetical protein
VNLENNARGFHKNLEILVALNKSEFMEFYDVSLRKTSKSLYILHHNFCVWFTVSSYFFSK